ncbi:hypothetical protein RHMOL_Rhmol08G0173200 [Rhododendron molle]|uniref:Uncharacterized protein n=1 Tax=Rhododendron molle TaxID=49168 RepID=A0ACC0MPP1_RHOML|nr:hypothetical protein RHMOL_Rhmol08G0173200 [Rhododendron molle]
MDYAAYQKDRLAGLLGVWAFRDIRSQARGAAEEGRAARERQRGGKGRVGQSLSGPVRGEPPEMSWKISVVDTQGNPAEIHLVPARAEPESVTVSVPNECVNEAVRRMLAMENVIRRAASGMPLELHYLAPTPPLAQRAAAQRPQRPSQEERDPKRARVTTPEATEVEEEEEEEEEGEEEEEQHPSTSSGYGDSVDDPPYKKDPQEQEDDDDSDDWLGGR